MTRPSRMHSFLGANLLWTFRQDVAWEVFFVWSHVNENEKKKKKNAKIQNLKFRQTLYNFGRDPP